MSRWVCRRTPRRRRRRSSARWRRRPQIVECHNVTGTVEYLLRAEVEDLDAYKTLHTDILGALPTSPLTPCRPRSDDRMSWRHRRSNEIRLRGVQRPASFSARQEAGLANVSEPAFIGVDWGTTSFRAYLADADGRALETLRRRRGRAGAEGRRARALSRRPPRLLAGAAGAGLRHGRRQAGLARGALCRLPRGPRRDRRRDAVGSDGASASCASCPASARPTRAGAPDVMRGEETQILGALAGGLRRRRLRAAGHAFQMGARRGRPHRRLRDLHDRRGLRGAEDPQRARPHDGPACAPAKASRAGVDAARALERPGDLLHAIFAARTFGLFETLPPDQLGEYLSGLLIGAEILAGARGVARGDGDRLGGADGALRRGRGAARAWRSRRRRRIARCWA